MINEKKVQVSDTTMLHGDTSAGNLIININIFELR